MRYMDEGPAKAEAINELIKIVQEDAPWTFGYFPTSSAAFHQWVHNGKPTQVVRNHIQYLRLDPETRVKAIKEWNKPIYWPLLKAGTNDRTHYRGGRQMIRYLLRRIGYGFLILIGVNLLTFMLFFTVNTPDDMARLNIGGKRVTAEAIQNWKEEHGYDKPLLWNEKAKGSDKLTDTIFWQHSARLMVGDLGASDAGRDIAYEIKNRMWPSVALAFPTFLLGVFVIVVFSLGLVFFRHTKLEIGGVVFAIVMMSVSSLFYIIFGQWLFSKVLRLVPISGFETGTAMISFLILPIAIGVFSRIGGDALLYRSMFLEEINKDYVRTARAKGLSETAVLFKHVLRNASLPILTSTVAVLPMLFLGSLVMESFFGIPGLGSFTIDAINAQDFAIVRTMVFVGTVLYVIGLILTDVAYTIADPRIRLK